MTIRALKVFELLKQKLVNYATIEGNPSRKEIQLAERIMSMVNSMDNKEQFEFEIIRDIYTDTIFENDKIEPISKKESLSFNEAFIPLEYARCVVETCKEHPK